MIRGARLRDFHRIVDLITDFARASPVEHHRQGLVEVRRTQNKLMEIQKSGIILVSETEGDIHGVIIGQIIPDMLFPEYKTLREIVWWVSPAHRNTTAGYKLLQGYLREGIELKSRGVIQDIVMTTLVNSPELKLESRGWQPIETNYLYRGVK